MFLLFLLLSGSPLQISALGLITQPPLQCSQKDLSCSVNISVTCLDEGWVKPRHEAPGMHPITEVRVEFKSDQRNETVPMLYFSLSLPPDGNVYVLRGLEMHVLEDPTNTSLCVRYIFNNQFPHVLMSDNQKWTFTLDRIVVDPGLRYRVAVFNLPKPDVDWTPYVLNITVPDCKDSDFQSLRACLENGSLWDPQISWSAPDNWRNVGEITVLFNTSRFSDEYEVYVRHAAFSSDVSVKVSKDNRSSISVPLSLDAWLLNDCVLVVGIKPFFIRCRNNCLHHQRKIHVCPYNNISSTYRHCIVWMLFGVTGLLVCGLVAVMLRIPNTDSCSSHDTADKGAKDEVAVTERSKVLVLYSQDHPLYTQVVLKLCAFLRKKCGAEVMLDLLDTATMSSVGNIQWLDMQRERLSSRSDKVLILCSPGVCAKWNALCGGRRLLTREDARSPMGDLLTPALSLIVPDFVRASSHCKYVIAYFDDICGEEDVPAPFNVAVKYQLMKHFEELFFRLSNAEKYEPGQIKHAMGLGAEEYHGCESGRALKESIAAFWSYQLEHPNWVEEELVYVDVDEGGLKEDGGEVSSPCCVLQNKIQNTESWGPVLINGIEHTDQSISTMCWTSSASHQLSVQLNSSESRKKPEAQRSVSRQTASTLLQGCKDEQQLVILNKD